jgi:hypothetical protein
MKLYSNSRVRGFADPSTPGDLRARPMSKAAFHAGDIQR